jgi:hypothetical protein
VIISLNLLISFYFIAAQIRDFLLRFHKNRIYGLDFVVQLLISGPVMILIFFHDLTVSRVIQIFVITYGIYALFLLIILSRKVKDFKFSNLIRKKRSNLISAEILSTDASFSRLGVLFQFSLSKDLLFGLFLLSKSDFGLMAALASFWVVVRFLRPAAVIQVKVSQASSDHSSMPPGGILGFITRASSAIYVQAFAIGIMGILGLLLTPVIMGSGFKPSVSMTVAGLISEILLMKCLYDLSTSGLKLPQNVFLSLCLTQILILGILRMTSDVVSISLIWFSSGVIYVAWQLINLAWKKIEPN